MKGEKLSDEIFLQEMAAFENFGKEIGWQIFAVQEQSERLLIERGIIENREQLVGRGFVNEAHEFVTGSGLQFWKIPGTHGAAPA
jgi:hypothetical protein